MMEGNIIEEGEMVGETWNLRRILEIKCMFEGNCGRFIGRLKEIGWAKFVFGNGMPE